MKLILLEKIKNLGGIGDQVNVKAGYARNFLVPYGKAVSATKENIAMFEDRRADLEKAAADTLAAAEARKAKLDEMTITLSAKASEEGKLFGSIGARDLAEAITAAGVELSKSEVLLPEGPVRMVGEFEIDLQLHSDVAASVKVIVNAE